MRKIILKMQLSLDGFIEGPNGEMDWILRNDNEAWDDLFELLQNVDTFLLGKNMYPAYADYWRKTLTNPSPPANDLKYARLADKTKHIVFSKTIESVEWQNTTIARGNLEDEIKKLKEENGKDMQVVGGAKLASSFINHNLIDEYCILVNPIILGGGKSLFSNVVKRHNLKLVRSKQLKSGIIILNYLPAKN